MFLYSNEICVTIAAECGRNSTKIFNRCDENYTTELSRI